MEKNFDSRVILQGVFDFGTCQRPDGSYYGHGGQKCHQGVQATLPTKFARHPAMKKLSPAQQGKVGAALEGFREAVTDKGYAGDGVQMWDKAIVEQLDALEWQMDRGSYDADKATASALNMWDPNSGRVVNEMLGKAPTKLDIDGIKTDPSLNMVPEVRSAQLGWRDPITNTKYKAATLDRETGELVAPKNNAGRGDSSIVLTGSGKAMLGYREELGASNWPPQPAVAAVDPKVVRKLSDENPSLWRSGFNNQDRSKDRSEAFDVYDIANKNPSAEVLALRQAKNDAVAEAYLMYKGRSPLTGREVPLPVGGNNVTVDHVQPLTSFGGPGVSKLQQSQRANVASNFHIVERDLNGAKNDGTHDALVSRVQKVTDGGFTRKMTNNWGTAGSKVTLSEPEFNARFPRAAGRFDNPADRQRFASAYEQRRIANMSGQPASTLVPTTGRKRGGADPLRAFTKPAGTIDTTAARPSRQAATTPRRTRRTGGITQTEREARAAGQRAAASKRDSERTQRAIDKAEKNVLAARAKRDTHKPGSARYNKANEKVNEARTEQRKLKKALGLIE